VSLIAWFLLALLVGVDGWLASGCFVPYLTGAEPEYLLLLRPLSSLVAWCAGAAILWMLAGRAVNLRSLKGAQLLAPLLLLALPLVSVALLASPLRRSVAPWLYVSIDMQAWLLITIGALVAVQIGRTSDRFDIEPWLERIDRLDVTSSARWWLDASLAAVLVTASLASSPPLRFQSVVNGDEPKYLRYLENWYRGRGMDVADLGPISELPAGFEQDLSGNFRSLGPALRSVADDLQADSRRLVGLPAPPRPGPARSGGGWFVDGQHGGVYQMHNPGISLLLLPGYLVDRAISRTHVWHPQFPSDLYFTNAILLILYVLWGRAVFRLLWTYTGHALIAWLLASIVLLGVQGSAFAYQYYPEAAAGLVAALVARYALLSDDGRRRSAIGYGLLAGFLPWLHLRFLPLMVAAVAAVAWTRRRDRQAALWFGAGVALPLVVLALYSYHVTGSMTPWALYALAKEEPLFSVMRVWRDLPALWLDRTWGLIAHAPVYLFALPGLWWTWHKQRQAAIAVGVALLVLAIPAAGHGYTAAYTTPVRLIAAVVPFLALPVADAVITYRSSSWWMALFGLLGVMTVHNGLAYNLNLNKSEEWLHASSISGWLFPLLLPDLEAGQRLRQPLTLVWIVVTIGLLCAPLIARRMRRTPAPSRHWSHGAVAVTVIVVFAFLSSAAGALSGVRFNRTFLLYPGDARDRLIHFELTEHPGLRWSSVNGRADLKAYFPNPEGTTTTLTMKSEHPRPRSAVEIAIEVRRPGNRPGWGTARVDFGDHTPPMSLSIEDTARIQHVYAQPGEYQVKATVELWGLPGREISETVRVDQE